MGNRKIIFTVGEFYHVYNRGNNKRDIFHDHNDYQRFMDLLFACNRKERFNFSDSVKGVSVYELSDQNPLVAIGAHSPMPNHFHILLTPLVENGVSLFMKKLSTAYTMYYNQKYKNSGALFQGRFKAKHIDSDRYLKYVFSYIHLNVDKIGIDPAIFIYSSFLDYAGTVRKENKIIDKSYFPDYFPSEEEFMKEIKDWIKYKGS